MVLLTNLENACYFERGKPSDDAMIPIFTDTEPPLRVLLTGADVLKALWSRDVIRDRILVNGR